MVNKKGLSAVVTTVIMILLVLVAIGIIWVVVQNLIVRGTEGVGLGKFTINLEVESVSVEDGITYVKVKRGAGEGDLSKIKFVISDGGGDSKTFEGDASDLDELEEKVFDLEGVGLVKEISLVPVLISESGKENLGNEVDKKVLSSKDTLKAAGAVSWWKLDGNANDEIGGNNGEINGDVDCEVEGKSGMGCEFDGNSDYIEVADDASLNFGTGEFTLSAWVNTGGAIDQGSHWNAILEKGHFSGNPSDKLYGFFIPHTGGNANKIFFVVNDKTNTKSDSALDDNEWHHIVGVRDSSGGLSMYVDGVQQSATATSGEDVDDVTSLIIGGDNRVSARDFNGLIDEVVIFNRALTEEEVKSLYGFDFSS